MDFGVAECVKHFESNAVALDSLDGLSIIRQRKASRLSKATGFTAVPVDVPVRWSGFLERGRPRPLNPPIMQTQPVSGSLITV